MGKFVFLLEISSNKKHINELYLYCGFCLA